eukprot:CAMPEP_0119491504 /NCGR_PEP_ID=MMETSP1344-20130328/16352_1 /TAXON_ID=236787 /ORGANISM="Florenciella parvula, Strain CCMP2471" /LENGTH=85 /DNA_ID=CAMNT_0007526755 /DNA_START=28 /DNA_END=283 /DNA_ORIENTATION=+
MTAPALVLGAHGAAPYELVTMGSVALDAPGLALILFTALTLEFGLDRGLFKLFASLASLSFFLAASLPRSRFFKHVIGASNTATS